MLMFDLIFDLKYFLETGLSCHDQVEEQDCIGPFSRYNCPRPLTALGQSCSRRPPLKSYDSTSPSSDRNAAPLAAAAAGAVLRRTGAGVLCGHGACAAHQEAQLRAHHEEALQQHPQAGAGEPGRGDPQQGDQAE